MNTTNTGAGGSGAPSTTTASPAATQSDAGSSVVQDVASSATVTTAAAPKGISSAAEEAIGRARARRSKPAGDAGKTSTSAGSATVSHANPEGADGAAPGSAAAGGTQAVESGKTDEGAAGAATAGSTEAPSDWPEQDRAIFSKLPEDGRKLLLEQAKRMQGAVTRGTTMLADERKKLGTLNTKMEQHQASPEVMSELLDTAVSFEADPRAVIERLAAQKGLKVHFGDGGETGDTMPEFKDTAEMAKWIEERAISRLQREQAGERDKVQKEQRHTARVNELHTQFGNARRDLPDFGEHEEAIYQAMGRATPLSVDEAYRIASYPKVKQQADRVTAMQAELATTKAELDGLRKKATAPPPLDRGGVKEKPDPSLTASQRAVARAKNRIAASQH